ncbi:hypothetical protein [Actinacidiphila glaucinigra]|uniref:Uncharacterized protein n=1 Tax=Actinacidiphila glaucinigra TaxID=235986 RepID=A0A239NUT0_9ACTN|nr:hypothetical protein [Actinacidiphila glaucinigra]SNT58462.1 hypothetical protein SAMN05216252_14923 [Actinacidiphila glaucinigra]
MTVFACVVCDAVLSAPLSQVALPVRARQTWGHGLLPVLMEAATYAVDPEPFGPPWRRWSEVGENEAAARGVFAPVDSLPFGDPGTIVIAPGDTRGTVLIPERCGGDCCGLDGRDGPKLACEQPVATRIDDCSLWQAVRFAPHAVRRIPTDDPAPRTADWQALATEVQPTPLVNPSGDWSPQWAAAAGVALAHLLAASDGTPVTVPDGLVADTLRRTLDTLLPLEPPANTASLAGPGLPRSLPPTSCSSRGIRGQGKRGSRCGGPAATNAPAYRPTRGYPPGPSRTPAAGGGLAEGSEPAAAVSPQPSRRLRHHLRILSDCRWG